MEGHEPLVDYTTERQTIKQFDEFLVHFLIVFIETFGSEIKVTCHLLTFVIASQHEDILWEIDLKRAEKAKNFN